MKKPVQFRWVLVWLLLMKLLLPEQLQNGCLTFE